MKFATGGCDGLVKLWNYNKDTSKFEEQILANYGGWIKDVAFAQYNSTGLAQAVDYLYGNDLFEKIAVCAEDDSVAILIKKDQKWTEQKLKDINGHPIKLSWSTDCHMLAVGFSDNKSQIFTETSAGKWEIVPENAEENLQDQNQNNNII
jgi:protein transport protein SEC13